MEEEDRTRSHCVIEHSNQSAAVPHSPPISCPSTSTHDAIMHSIDLILFSHGFSPCSDDSAALPIGDDLPFATYSDRKTMKNGVTRSLMPCTYPLAGCLIDQMYRILSNIYKTIKTIASAQQWQRIIISTPLLGQRLRLNSLHLHDSFLIIHNYM